jgi:uncharacterized protein (TIGR03382 family)
MRRFALAAWLVAGLASGTSANGRSPAVSTIHFGQGHEQDIVAGLTFGLVISRDSGATWQWMCEAAVGYGGMYDPGYAYTHTGAIFATTFNGLKVNRDGCMFVATPPGTTFVTAIALGPDHALYYGASTDADSHLYKSTDDGTTFPTSTLPGVNGDSWLSLAVAPSDAQRVYATGYRFVKVCNASSTNAGMTCTMNQECTGTGAMCESEHSALLFKSINGGTSFTAMGQTGLVTTMDSLITVAGIDSTQPDTLYVKVTLENPLANPSGDGIFKSTNGGMTWTKIREAIEEPVSFVARANGELVAASPTMGAFKSTNGGTTWTPLSGAPHINCLYENSAGEVWACTQNTGTISVPGDGFGIMKTTDLQTWTGVLAFQNIKQPVACDPGTAQRDQCVESYMSHASVWCCLEDQLMITSTAIDCSSAPRSCALPLLDGAVDGGTTVVHPGGKGCCETGDGAAPGVLVLGLVSGGILLRRRRPRC